MIYLYSLFFQNSWFEDNKRLFTSWVFFRSTRLRYATSKNHRKRFKKKKKILWKKFKEEKRRKNNVAKEKKETLFCLKYWLLNTTRYSPEDPLRAKKKKNKVTFPVKFKLVPLVLLLYERKQEKAYLQQVHVVKSLTSYLFKPTERG